MAILKSLEHFPAERIPVRRLKRQHEQSGPLQPILSGCARQSAGVLQRGGSGVARAHGALEGGREAGRRPIAGEDEVAARGAGRGPSRRILGGRREGRAALLNDLPGRQRLRPRPVRPAISVQIASARASRGSLRRRSAPLMVTDRRSGKANSHSVRPPTRPVMGAVPGGGVALKCALTMARNVVGTVRPGTRSAAIQGGTASTTVSLGPESDARVAEIEPLHRVSGETEGPQAATEMHRRAPSMPGGAGPGRRRRPTGRRSPRGDGRPVRRPPASRAGAARRALPRLRAVRC